MPAQKIVELLSYLEDRTFVESPILQAEMLYSIGLKNRIRRLQAELDTFNSGLLHRLQRGAKVEPGAHTANLVRRRHGRRYSEEIEIR